MATRIQIRRDTAANWASVNPMLAAGEIAYETDTDLIKIGNGVSLWNNLGYVVSNTPSNITANSVNITTTSASTNTATGALTVAGGAGIAGNLNIGMLNTTLHNIQGNVVFGYGTNIVASADTILTINLNNTVPQLAPNNTVHLSGADGKHARYGVDSFGVGITSSFSARHARGTSSNPSASQTGDILGSFIARGYGTTGFPQTPLAPGINIVADENYTDTSQGAYFNFLPTPVGSIIATTAAKLTSNNLSILTGTASTNPFSGALLVNGGVGIAGNLNVNGTTHYIAGNVSVGHGIVAVPGTALTVNQSGAYLTNSSATAHIAGFSGQTTKLTVETYNQGNSTIGSMVIARTSQGTASAPSASLLGDVLGAFVGRGYGASSYALRPPLSSSGMVVQATQNFSDTQQGTNLLFNATANGAISASTVMTVTGSGNVVIAGNLSISATTGTPTSTVSAAGWLKVQVGTNYFYLPLYQ